MYIRCRLERCRSPFIQEPVISTTLYAKYKALAEKQDKVVFGGRLGMYRYFDMDDTIAAALEMAEKIL
ncbi:UDP-galactopyranose mutase [Treponema saccharophilum]|uniref:UDP-galactopyranose mutase n=1 Tax=Treponema saccharophilum DSM 2985 TaxID=907348 RepID=H7EM80_9SPIR|nr:UDP-galactopyranose mutase [Treponema saccharophilum]EIC01165.1 UDP-galactopyranose mutase [Treponema saccharophilum DSM 2985]BDC95919.1 hypothetical protein TRSA_10180 [Treponema saccharophilum]